MSDEQPNFLGLTAEIVSNYVSNNRLSPNDVPALIAAIHGALAGTTASVEEKKELSPAVPVRKSVTPDAIICLEDGRSFKSLRRHLATRYGMTPEDYRAKWGLPKDYPTVAPNYAQARSELAKAMGLGSGGRRTATTSTAGSREAATAAKKAPAKRAARKTT